jgi:hypothetical protein
MSRMIDLIRTSSVPANLMQAAARGALSVPAPEMIEILVHLASQNRVFGQQARMTLAGWDEKSSLAAASDPATSKEVLEYLIAPENLRPQLLPALLENPSVSVETLITLAASGTKEVADALHNSPRAQRVPEVLSALASNSNISATETAAIHQQLAATGFEDPIHEDAAPHSDPATPDEADQPLVAYLTEHAAALAAEGEKAFNPVGGMYMEDPPAGAAQSSPGPPDQEPVPSTAQVPIMQAAIPAQPAAPADSAPAAHAASASAAAAKPALKAKKPAPAEEDRGSALQKIARLDIKGRIKLAMKGDKEMRSILVRDGTKLVALAVLESPKITDGEVEKIAAQKNVLEAVLRQIPMKRRFMKNYIVVRNLVANPRTPLDVSLGLMKNIMVNDLRNMASNKDISETVRKLAIKMFKQKSEPQKKSTG